MHKILATLLAILMFVGVAQASLVPMPVSLHIKNEGVLSGYDVEMTNLRTGETQFLVTDSSGYAQFDWSGSKLDFAVGDQIKTTVVSCSGVPECTILNTIKPGPQPIYFVVDLSNAVCPVCVVCGECESCVECKTCPKCPDVTVNCPECDVCETCEECPEIEGDNSILAGLIGALLGSVGALGAFLKLFNNKIFTGARTGMKVYRGEDGSIKVYHKHPGTSGYHDPNIVHRGKEAHPKGMIDVADGYAKVNGEWVYGG